LKGKYGKVVLKIKHIFEQQKYDVSEMILALSATDDENQTIFSNDEAFVKITNTNQLFLWIGKYCSMYDYELLLALVESTECEEAIKLLDDFSESPSRNFLRDDFQLAHNFDTSWIFVSNLNCLYPVSSKP